MADFVWSEPRKKAAELLAAKDLSQTEIGIRCGVARETIWVWRQMPEFAERVANLEKEFEAEVLRRGIANRLKRVESQNDRWNRLHKVMDARSEDPTMAEVPGGRTGTLVRQLKGIGKGDDYQVVEEYAVDTGLLRELRELEKQVAMELGQWEANDEPTKKPDASEAVQGQVKNEMNEWWSETRTSDIASNTGNAPPT